MNQIKRFVPSRSTVGDAAVDGLISGVVAGLAMAAYLIATALLSGEGPGTVLGRFAAGETTSPVTGGLSHLAVSAAYGALFGVGWWMAARHLPRTLPAWLAGFAYALVLLILAVAVVLPRTDSPLDRKSVV
jgi:hypothetical protein